MRPHSRRTPLLRTLLAAGVATATVAVLVQASPSAETTSSPVRLVAANLPTPGNFTGYGFDQCETVSQAKMDAWLAHSPYRAVGVYISGNSRACKVQANLTPTWVATQLTKGWKILPITLGPQSTCVGRFPRYGATIDPTIINSSANSWASARFQGSTEAASAVSAATALGIVPGSTLWYDLEGWSDYTNATCRESALNFLSSWTARLHQLGYVSGVYSSAGSGMRILDDARVNRPGTFTLPDRIWIARWDGVANTSTSYIREDGWRPGNRMKQYRGGHNETWGGVTINIDSNYLELGATAAPAPAPVVAPEIHCGGIRVDWGLYPTLRPGARNDKVRTLKCLLLEQGYGGTALDRYYGRGLKTAIYRWQSAHGFAQTSTWAPRHWISLHAQGPATKVQLGSTGPAVRRVQRALNAATPGLLAIDGVMNANDVSAVKAWQGRVGLPQTGVVADLSWARLRAGRR